MQPMTLSSPHNKQSGFTLLEVLLALSVLAIALVALIGVTQNTLFQTTQALHRNQALWVGVSVMERLEQPALHTALTGDENVYHHHWHYVANLIRTPNPDISKIKLTLYQDGTAKPQMSLQGYRFDPPRH